MKPARPTPGAALPAAAESALDVVLRLDAPADLALRRFFQANPRLGRRDRGWIAETVFDALRHRRRYVHASEHLRGSAAARLVKASRVRRAAPGDALVDLDPNERDALRASFAIDPAALPQPVRLSLPDWLYADLLDELGEAGVESLGSALLEPAPLDLRANLLKADRAALLRALADAGIDAAALEDTDAGVRVVGKPAIEKLPQFEAGWFEVQDAGSQRLAQFCAPRRGQTVVDFCAGAGGKTLALAALMRSSGQVYACDVSTARLTRMRPRLARSGATNVQPLAIADERDPKLARLAARADLVLVDAPCSGTGTLRRNPELKWRMTPSALEELVPKQRAILSAAARLVKPKGALVYSTCSLLRRENEAVVEAFSTANPQFGPPSLLKLRPDLDGCDGFFAARWTRNS